MPPAVAFFTIKSLVRESRLNNAGQGSAFIYHFVKAYDAPARQFWNMMPVAPITDNEAVLWKICYNSRSQDINYQTKVEQVGTQPRSKSLGWGAGQGKGPGNEVDCYKMQNME